MLNEKRGKGQPKKPYRTKIFSIRHNAEVIDKLRKRLSAKEFQKRGQEWLNQLAEDND